MSPQRAEPAPAVADAPVAAALGRGRAWLTALIDRDGCIGGSNVASLYYKAPAALVLNGELGAALRAFRWLAEHCIGADGELSVPADQPAPRAYDRGWLVWGASLCGRYDLAFALAEDLAAHQNPSTGGFWDSKDAVEGTHHAMTAGMAGLGLLSVRHVEAARRAADFLIELLRRQPHPEEGFFLTARATSHGLQDVVTDRSSSDFVDRSAGKQRPARIGPVQILLIRLYQLSGDRRYLDAAVDYSRIFLDGAPGIYDCVESHKFLWGLDELYDLTADDRLRDAADRIVAYLLSKQQRDGQWWGDALGGDREGQSLDLRVNTTCNVLVGLGYHRHLRPAWQAD